MKLKPELIRLDAARRIHQLDRPVIGLTGGISTGKSTVAELLKARGFSVINADLLVKGIYRSSEAHEFIYGLCPEALQQGNIHFPTLREKVFSNTELKAKVENFIYQRLPQAFLNEVKSCDPKSLLVYDVPLLFERQLDVLVDLTVVVYAPLELQKARLMKRDGHLEEMALNIISQQLGIEEKKRRADYVIDNSQTETELVNEVDRFLAQILA